MKTTTRFLDQMDRAEMQCEIMNERTLFAMVNEDRFLADGYSDDELRAIITAWVAAGDECA